MALVMLVTALGFGLVTWQWREAEAARRHAEQANQAVDIQRHQAEAARQSEEERKRQFQRLSTSLLLDRGLRQCEDDDAGHGLLWLARTLELLPAEDADLQRVLRSNFADWGRQVHPLHACLSHRCSVEVVAFSPDGKFVLTASRDGIARLWDGATGQPSGPAVQQAGPIMAAAFSPDGAGS